MVESESLAIRQAVLLNLIFFRTDGFQPAQTHDAGWKPAVRKSM